MDESVKHTTNVYTTLIGSSSCDGYSEELKVLNCLFNVSLLCSVHAMKAVLYYNMIFFLRRFKYESLVRLLCFVQFTSQPLKENTVA